MRDSHGRKTEEVPGEGMIIGGGSLFEKDDRPSEETEIGSGWQFGEFSGVDLPSLKLSESQAGEIVVTTLEMGNNDEGLGYFSRECREWIDREKLDRVDGTGGAKTTSVQEMIKKAIGVERAKISEAKGGNGEVAARIELLMIMENIIERL